MYHVGIDEIDGLYTESIKYNDLSELLEFKTVKADNVTHEIYEDKWVLKNGKSLKELGELIKSKPEKVSKINFGRLKEENDALKELLIEKNIITKKDLDDKILAKKSEKSYSGTTKVKNIVSVKKTTTTSTSTSSTSTSTTLDERTTTTLLDCGDSVGETTSGCLIEVFEK